MNVWKTQGVLLLLILSGTDSSSTFSPDAGVSRTKGYLIFILAFAAITNIVVSFVLCLREKECELMCGRYEAPGRINIIPIDKDLHAVKG